MNLAPDLAGLLRHLLLDRSVAALATLHDGRPFASMVPFAATTATGRLVLVTHVSGLAAHTRDMRSHPDCCLLITAAESDGLPPQALPRISIPAVAEFVPAEIPQHAVLKAAYLNGRRRVAGAPDSHTEVCATCPPGPAPSVAHASACEWTSSADRRPGFAH